jgi:hypothetical protein
LICTPGKQLCWQLAIARFVNKCVLRSAREVRPRAFR